MQSVIGSFGHTFSNTFLSEITQIPQSLPVEFVKITDQSERSGVLPPDWSFIFMRILGDGGNLLGDGAAVTVFLRFKGT